MDRFTNSLHKEKLEIIIVHGVMLSIPHLATSSLASLMICAILLGLVLMVFLTTKMHTYMQTFIMQVQCNDRGSHS